MTATRDAGAIRYRPAGLADMPALTEVRMSVTENVLTDPSRATPAEVAAYLTEIGRGWVAEVDGVVVGFCLVNRSGLVWALFVRPGYEGRRIGATLLSAGLDWLRARGLTYAFLDTGAGTRAEGFYRRQGWTEASRQGNRIDFQLDL